MKIDRLAITDFGPYRGRNEFDLRTTPDSPIILFGGKNGAGKTTLFKSVQLCLHGRSALGRRTSASEYEEEIRAHLHDGPDGPSETASIELQFEYAKLGDRDTYVVERSWRDRGKSIVEDLTVERNGEELSDLDGDQWEDFLKELIPPGVTQLFFFDGEQVQRLASAIENNAGFEESLRSLLGLELVERLEADLSLYLSNKLDQEGKSELREQLEELREELDQLNEELHDVEYEIAEHRDELSDINRKIASLEDELAQQGGDFAEKRSELKDRRAELQSTEERIKQEIRDEVMGKFPFALAPELCRNVRDRLQRESKTHHIEAAREQVADELETILEEDETVGADLPDEDREQLLRQLQSALLSRSEEGDDTTLATAFSERQRQRMYSVVDRALREVPRSMEALTRELEDVTRDLTTVEKQINRAPEEDAISPLMRQINEHTEQKGEIKAQIQDLEKQREELDRRITHLETERDRKIDKEAQLEEISERASLAKGAREAIQKYRSRLTERKLARLEDVLTNRYRQISNKSDFYQKIHIGKESLEITIETANGSMKEQSQLSAGERQIFATAMIWALAEISDRPLPFIIDTPLGRLDQEHRENLVKHFFSEASHQVLVLSTDTEITDEYYDFLSQRTATQYHLHYNEDDGFTEISQGYFDDEMGPSLARDSESRDNQVTIEGFNE